MLLPHTKCVANIARVRDRGSEGTELPSRDIASTQAWDAWGGCHPSRSMSDG